MGAMVSYSIFQCFRLILSFSIVINNLHECLAAVPTVGERFEQLVTRNYNRKIRPFAGAGAVNVEVSFMIKSFRSINDQTMDYKFECYFQEEWFDDRLQFSIELFGNQSFLQLPEDMAALLWLPDTFIPNAIESKDPNINSISHRGMLRVRSDGYVFRSRRYSVTAECPMDLKLYPFDIQICPASVESYGYTESEVLYKWRKVQPIIINANLEMPAFKLQDLILRERSMQLNVGNFSRLNCCFVFVRSAGMFYLQVFLPAVAIVIMAWLVLWTRTDNKFSDMIAVILAITLQYFSYNTVMPHVSYIKAMDIFMVICFLFVFAALLRQSVKDFLRGRKRTLSARHVSVDSIQDNEVEIVQLPIQGRGYPIAAQISLVVTSSRVSNILYISLFGLFCIAYFGVLVSLDAQSMHRLSNCDVYD